MITQDQFESALTRSGLSGDWALAAKAHLVGGISQAEAGRRHGISRASVNEAVKKIREELANAGLLVEVTYKINPKHKAALDAVVREMGEKDHV